MGIPNMHTTIDYKKLIELQAKAVEGRILPENQPSRGKIRQKSRPVRKNIGPIKK